MRDRLYLLKGLLDARGAIWISIDDNELYHLRLLMDEIFGRENFIANIIWQKVYTSKNTAQHSQQPTFRTSGDDYPRISSRAKSRG